MARQIGLPRRAATIPALLAAAALLTAAGCVPPPDGLRSSASTTMTGAAGITTTPQNTTTAGAVPFERLIQLRQRVRDKYSQGTITAPAVKCDPLRPELPRSVSLAIEVDLGCGCCGGWEPSGIEDDDLDVLVAFPSIRELNLKFSSVTDNSVARLAAELPHLQSLNLQDTPITSSGLHPLIRLKDLRTLTLSTNQTDDEALRVFGQLPKIKKISLYGTQATDRGFAYLAGCSGLQSLSAPGTAITDEGIARFASRPKPQLTHLSLAQTGITDAGLAHLAKIDSLQHLDLSGTGVTDAGLVHLAELKNLTSLSLNGLPITSRGLRRLAGLTRMKGLYLSQTKVTDDGLQHLQRMRDLNQLWLAKTTVRGYGFAALEDLDNLRYTSLPPLDAAAIPAVNAIRSWQRLDLDVRGHPADSGDATRDDTVVRIADQPNLRSLELDVAAEIDQVLVEECPRLSSIQLTLAGPLQRIGIAGCDNLQIVTAQAAMPVPIQRLDFSELPSLRQLRLENVAAGAVHSEDALENVERYELQGTSDSDALRRLLGAN